MLRKLFLVLILGINSAAALAISKAELFDYAQANYPSIFSGTATPGFYLQYTYQYYPGSGTYLAVDNNDKIFMKGPFTHDAISEVGTVADYQNAFRRFINQMGPQGPAGPAGPTGAQGPAGPAGTDGSAGSINVFDANNQYLGVLLGSATVIFVPSPISAMISFTGGVDDISHFYFYDPSKNNYPLVSPSIPPGDVEFFTSSDCSGPAYTAPLFVEPSNFTMPMILKGVGAAAGKFYVYKLKTIAEDVMQIQSTLSSPGFPEFCSVGNTPFRTEASTFELKEVTLPFTLPLALPLRFE